MTISAAVDGAGEALWRRAVDGVLKGGSFEAALTCRTADGLTIAPLYARADGPAMQPLREAARPVGVVQGVDHPDAAAANALALADLAGGASGLVLALHGSVGARGFGLNGTGRDLEQVLAGVDLAGVALRLDGGGQHALAGLVLARRLDPAALDIDFGLDPIGAMARDGVDRPGWDHAAGTLVRDLRGRDFRAPMVRADGRPFHEAGATEAQDLASVLATAVAYLRALEAAGLSLDQARDAISFTLATDTDLMLSVAKLRALRRLWANVEAACELEPRPLRLHAETAWRSLTRRDPYGNLLRGTIAATAAILGGADSVTVLPFTAALGLPDMAARRLARNTTLILIEEASLGRVADPAGGAGGFEALTAALCDKAWALFQGIEAAGGFPAALRSGVWQAAVAASQEARHAGLAEGTRAIVGTSIFAAIEDRAAPVLMHPPPPTPAARAPDFPPLRSARDAEPFERHVDVGAEEAAAR